MGLSYDPSAKDGIEEGKTAFTYIIGVGTKYETEEKSEYIAGFIGNEIRITLFKHTLSAFANELGDTKFAVERPETVREQNVRVGYWDKSTSQFSNHYQEYVNGARKEKPNPHSKEY